MLDMLALDTVDSLNEVKGLIRTIIPFGWTKPLSRRKCMRVVAHPQVPSGGITVQHMARGNAIPQKPLLSCAFFPQLG